MPLFRRLSIVALTLAAATTLAAQTDLSTAYHWRMIGPFRGGRTKSAVGVPSQPNVFYIGAVNGGVWKTTDYGRTWTPIFDANSTNSIGDVQVAPSDPNVVYVGSGEGLQRPDLSTGDGMYKSSDAGKTWTHLGLRDGWQITRIAVDPTNANRLFVAVLGHPYGPNAERGVFRSTDGGEHFEKVLFKDDNTGAADVEISPNDPNTVYAALWAARLGPWENGYFFGPGSGLYKSTDGGNTWKQLTTGLPGFEQGLSRLQIAISPSEPTRLYLNVSTYKGEAGGVYRSNDAGESFTRITADERIWGRGDDFTPLVVDPKNADVLYSSNVVAWKSTDAGKTWHSFRGAPGGDDYQRFWINPNDPRIILLVSDQGAVITVNGGESWSSWYNQPTAQFYHVTADNAFPYRLCGGQQESGSACVQSRGDYGSIGYREWTVVGADEYSYVAPDPLDPDIVYGGKISKWDRRTGQTSQVGPRATRRDTTIHDPASTYRNIRTQPIQFSPTNPRKLYFATNVLFETVNGGHSWKAISPDLSRPTWTPPANVGVYTGTDFAKVSRRGVIYAIAPSSIDSNTIWAGTDDGLIHVTRNNGKSWTDVTPPALTPWAKVSIMDASHFDANEAYAAVNTIRLDEQRPHLYRTRDGGKTWTEIVSGIATDASTNVIREDPTRRGLLFAGTEAQVWYSLDDGDHWMPLRLNMPVQSIRDLIIKDADVAVASHGRGFWILDDISALRQMPSSGTPDTRLFKPALATRVRYSMYTDTPVPPDEPMAENPPDGAVVDYYLAADAKKVALDVIDARGRVVRHYSSDDKFDAPHDTGNWPWYWYRPLHAISARAGLQRQVWDMHFAPPPVANFSMPISATPFNTLPVPQGPFAAPGKYAVKLTVDGKSYTQPLTVRVDPRVRTPAAGLQEQATLSVAMYDGVRITASTWAQVKSLRAQLKTRHASANASLQPAIDSLDAQLAKMDGTSGASSFGALQGQMLSVMEILQSGDGVPTAQAVAAASAQNKALIALSAKWSAFVKSAIPAMNARFGAAGMEPLKIEKDGLPVPGEPDSGSDEP